MGLHLEDKWIWDFWFAQDGVDTHVFYLQAARSLGDEHLRHWHVSIGHAVSQDLRTWTVLPDALWPSQRLGREQSVWDDYTTWTGSVIKHDNLWYMFYTGTCHAENGLVQRIGMATSLDLLTWKKHGGNPVIQADPRWYELLDLSKWHDQAWRDPYVMQDPQNGLFHAFVTARKNEGPADNRGVIGHATSMNLIDWEVHPPLSVPADFGHLEVPQVVQIQNRWYLLFSSPYETQAKAYQARTGRKVSGTHYFVADSMLGPYRAFSDDYLVGDERGTLYSGKLIKDADGQWVFMAFENMDVTGAFLGNLSDPHPVMVVDDGRLMVLR